MSDKLDHKEISVIQMALQTLIEDNEAVLRTPKIRLTLEARILAGDMIKTANSALEKIRKASGHAVHMQPYKEGDEKEFLTPES